MLEVTTYRLSIEELALILAQSGQVETSRELIASQLGAAASEAEVQASMLTAAHGLLANGWLELDADGTPVIDPELQRITGLLTEAQVSLCYSRADQDAEYRITYHKSAAGVFAHVIEHGIIHAFTELPHTDDAIFAGGVEFFEVAEAAPFSVPEFELPLEALNAIKDERDVGVITRRLHQAGAPETAASLMAEDLAATQYRGAALRVEYTQNNEPVSDRGLLLLRGPQRLWIMRQAPEGVTVMPGIEAAFRNEVAALLR